MTIKNQVNRKFTASDKYRNSYDKIFGNPAKTNKDAHDEVIDRIFGKKETVQEGRDVQEESPLQTEAADTSGEDKMGDSAESEDGKA